jgi:ATP-dependent Clp protease ATP-binding subunit ClpA
MRLPTAEEMLGPSLNTRLKQNDLRPCVGRDEDIKRVIRTLSLADKPHPFLVGESGVGKTAIVEGLTHRIERGDVPEHLLGRQIHSVPVERFMNEWVGGIERNLTAVLSKCEDEGLILFLDEFHMLASVRGEGIVPATEIIKKYLRDAKKLSVIAATTVREYLRDIKPNQALAERFSEVIVREPDNPTSTHILLGSMRRHEDKHKVLYEREIVKYVVDEAARRLPGQLPNKAFGLLDRAGVIADEDSRRKRVPVATMETVESAVRTTTRGTPKGDYSKSALKQMLVKVSGNIAKEASRDAVEAIRSPEYLVDYLDMIAGKDLDFVARVMAAAFRSVAGTRNRKIVERRDVEAALLEMQTVPFSDVATVVEATGQALKPFVLAAGNIADAVERLFETRPADPAELDTASSVEGVVDSVRQQLPTLMGVPDAHLTLRNNILWERAEKEVADLNVHFLNHLLTETLKRRGRHVGDGGMPEVRRRVGKMYTSLFYARGTQNSARLEWRGILLTDLAKATVDLFWEDLKRKNPAAAP